MSCQRKWGPSLSHSVAFIICKRRKEPEAVEPAECSSLSPKVLQCLSFAHSLFTQATTLQCISAQHSEGIFVPVCLQITVASKGGFGPVCLLDAGPVLLQALAERPPLKGYGGCWCQEFKPSSPLPLLAVPVTPQASGIDPQCHVCGSTFASAQQHSYHAWQLFMLAGWEPQLEQEEWRSGNGRSQEVFCSFPAQCIPGQSSPFGRISFCYCPSSFNVGQDFIKEENEDEVSTGFPAGWVWEASNMFPWAPHLRCFCLLSCWSLLQLQDL